MRIFVEEDEKVVAEVKIQGKSIWFIIIIFFLWLGISNLLNVSYMPEKMVRAGAYGLLLTGIIIGATDEFAAYIEKIARPPQG